MAEPGQRRNKAAARASSQAKKTRVQSAITLTAICGAAIFFGYFIGQYAIQMLVGESAGGSIVHVEQAPAGGGSSSAAAGGPLSGAPVGASQPAVPGAATSAAPTNTAGGGTHAPASAGATSPSPASQAASTPVVATAQRPPVANPPAASAPTSQAVRAAENVMHRVQVGGYAERSGAEGLLAELRRAGFADAFVTFNTEYRVQVGSFASRSGADSVAQTLRQLGYVVHLVPVE